MGDEDIRHRARYLPAQPWVSGSASNKSRLCQGHSFKHNLTLVHPGHYALHPDVSQQCGWREAAGGSPAWFTSLFFLLRYH